MTMRSIDEHDWNEVVKSIGIAQGRMQEQQRTIATLERVIESLTKERTNETDPDPADYDCGSSLRGLGATAPEQRPSVPAS